MKWENHFTKGIEKKRQGTSINGATLFVKKKPEFDPKGPN